MDERALDAVRMMLAGDIIRFLKDIIGSEELSSALGVSSTMISRYASGRSIPSRKTTKRLLEFLAKSMARIISSREEKAVHDMLARREYYSTVAALIAFKYWGSVGLTVSYSDVSFAVGSLVSHLMRIPLGIAWRAPSFVPNSMCRIDRCDALRHTVLCISLPKVSPSNTVLIITSPFVNKCETTLLAASLRKRFSNIISINILNIGESPRVNEAVETT